jgi:hypothetical protein
LQPVVDNGTTAAPEGMIYVCTMCGRTSETRYGFDEHERDVATVGWDEACMLHAILCSKQRLLRNKQGFVINAIAAQGST